MYVKLVPVNDNNDAYSYNLFLAVRDVINGTITQASDLNTYSTYLQTGQCVVSGTGPSAGVYHTFTDTIANNDNNSALTFYKKYHHQDTGFTPSVFMKLQWFYGLGLRMFDSNEANPYPFTSTSSLLGTNPVKGPLHTSASLYNSNGTVYIEAVHIIINDNTLLIHITSCYNGLNSDVINFGSYTTMINDLDYVPTIDDEAFTNNNAYCPTVFSGWHMPACMKKDYYSIQDNPNYSNLATTSTSSSYYGTVIVVGRNNYLDANGSYRNHYNGTDTNYVWNNAYPQVYYPYLFRDPLSNIYNFPGYSPCMATNIRYPSAALIGNQPKLMIPVQYTPNTTLSSAARNFPETYDSRFGTMVGYFRTSDGIGPDGMPVTVGNKTYRAFRLHKTGHQYHYLAKYTACYCFPED